MAFDASTLFDVSHLVTFLGGTLVGCAGQYFADRFTDQRRNQESEFASKKQFLDLKSIMSELFAEIRSDLLSDPSHSVRQFVIVPNDRMTFNTDKHTFIYYENIHPYIRAQSDRLMQAGYLEETATGAAPIYILQERFVVLLKNDS